MKMFQRMIAVAVAGMVGAPAVALSQMQSSDPQSQSGSSQMQSSDPQSQSGSSQMQKDQMSKVDWRGGESRGERGFRSERVDFRGGEHGFGGEHGGEE